MSELDNQTYDLEKVCHQVQDWVKELGAFQLKYFRSNQYEVTSKSCDSDLVTNVDRESEQFLRGKIREHYPETQVLGEEYGLDEDVTSPFRWIIDPIDGTTNFIQGLPMFTISIALYRENEALVGVVYAPYMNEMYAAVSGKGATLNGNRIEVSRNNSLALAVVGTGFPVNKGTAPDNNFPEVIRVLPKISAIRRMGSAAYDLCCVGSGFLDGYWELGLNIWDAAAGLLVVQEAGGRVEYLRQYDDPNRLAVLVGNDALVGELMANLEGQARD